MDCIRQVILLVVCSFLLLEVPALPLNDDSYYYNENDYGDASDPDLDVEDYSADEIGGENLEYMCPDREYSVPLDLLCDGFPDCSDGTDEDEDTCRIYKLASSTASTTIIEERTVEKIDEFDINYYSDYDGCSEAEFQCSSLSALCIPQSSVCDGQSDCPDGEDEANCGDTRNIPEVESTTARSPPSLTTYLETRMLPEVPIATNATSFETAPVSSNISYLLGQEEKTRTLTTMEIPSSSPVLASRPSLVFLTPPARRDEPKFFSLPKQELDSQDALEAIARLLPSNLADTKNPIQLTGESGETNAEFYQDIHSLNNQQVENFLQNFKIHGQSDSDDRLLLNNRFSESAESTVVLVSSLEETTTIATKSVSQAPSPRPRRKKKFSKKSQKKEIKNLLYLLVRKMGKLMSSNIKNRDMDVNIRIGGRTSDPRKRNRNEASRLNDLSEMKGQRRKPRVRLSLELKL